MLLALQRRIQAKTDGDNRSAVARLKQHGNVLFEQTNSIFFGQQGFCPASPIYSDTGINFAARSVFIRISAVKNQHNLLLPDTSSLFEKRLYAINVHLLFSSIALNRIQKFPKISLLTEKIVVYDTTVASTSNLVQQYYLKND